MNETLTVLEEVQKHMQMPKKIWTGNVSGPFSFDDPFEITFWYTEKESEKPRRFTISLEVKSIKEGW